MHTLIGLIQLLLVLTQSRLVPNLAFVWQAEKAVVIKAEVPVGKLVGWMPATTREWHQVDALPRDDKDKWVPQPWEVLPGYQPQDRSKLLWPKAFAGSDKLYLVFCQLKTEG